MASIVPLNINFKQNTESVVIVSVDFWVDLLEKHKSFKWVKVNHGIFDIISRIPNVDKLNSQQIAKKIFPHRHQNNRRVPSNIYINIIDKLISNIRNYDKLPSNYYIGVSDSNGLNHPRNKKRHKSVIDIIGGVKKRNLLHGGLLRRYVVSGDINKIFDAAKKNGYKIHVIGPEHCKHYKRFLGEFNHIVIPKANALANLDGIVNKSKKSLSGKDIFFTSLTTGTFLFIDKFKEDNVTIIDIGRGLDYLIKEHKSVKGQAWLNSKYIGFYKNFVKGYDYDLKKHIIKNTNNI
jgi:hypothetical protein